MSAVKRLAAALEKSGLSYEQPLDRDVARVLAADPDLAADIELGAAWREVEAALPEGWNVGLFRTEPGSWASWSAEAEPPTGLVGVTAPGPTPTAALRNLTEKLCEPGR